MTSVIDDNIIEANEYEEAYQRIIYQQKKKIFLNNDKISSTFEPTIEYVSQFKKGDIIIIVLEDYKKYINNNHSLSNGSNNVVESIQHDDDSDMPALEENDENQSDMPTLEEDDENQSDMHALEEDDDEDYSDMPALEEEDDEDYSDMQKFNNYFEYFCNRSITTNILGTIHEINMNNNIIEYNIKIHNGKSLLHKLYYDKHDDTFKLKCNNTNPQPFRIVNNYIFNKENFLNDKQKTMAFYISNLFITGITIYSNPSNIDCHSENCIDCIHMKIIRCLSNINEYCELNEWRYE